MIWKCPSTVTAMATLRSSPDGELNCLRLNVPVDEFQQPRTNGSGSCLDLCSLPWLRAPMATCATASAAPHQDRNSDRDRPNRAHQDHPLEILKALESCSGSRWSSAKRWTYRDSQTPRRRTGMPGVGSGFPGGHASHDNLRTGGKTNSLRPGNLGVTK